MEKNESSYLKKVSKKDIIKQHIIQLLERKWSDRLAIFPMERGGERVSARNHSKKYHGSHLSF